MGEKKRRGKRNQATGSRVPRLEDNSIRSAHGRFWPLPYHVVESEAPGLKNAPAPVPVVASRPLGLVNKPAPVPVVASRAPGLVNKPAPIPAVASRASGLENKPAPGPVVPSEAPRLKNRHAPVPVVASRAPRLVNKPAPIPVVASRAPGLGKKPTPGSVVPSEAPRLKNGPATVPVAASRAPGLVKKPVPGPVVPSEAPGLKNGPASVPVVASTFTGLLIGPWPALVPMVKSRVPGLVNEPAPVPVVASKAPGLVNGPARVPVVASRAPRLKNDSEPVPVVASKPHVPGSGTGHVDGSRSVPVPVAGSGFHSVYVTVFPESKPVEVDYTKIVFLMRGIRGSSSCTYMGYQYQRNEFYKISVVKKDDGESEFVAMQWCESQLNCVDGISSMYPVRSRIYNISRYLSKDVTKVPQSLLLKPTTHGVTQKLGCHTGLSWIDSNDPKKWNPGYAYKFYNRSANCAVLDDNIYCLQNGLLRWPRCYLTLENKWVTCHPPPPEAIFECQVTPKMVSQPSQGRILVHVTDYDSSHPRLYAWTTKPRYNSWELITQDISFGLWNYGYPFLVDDIIYFYSYMCPPYFAAYDLTNKKWVKVHWSAPFPPDAAGYEADTMLYLGNRLLCLAKSRPIASRNPESGLLERLGIYVTFAVFRFHTTYNPVGDRIAIFTHLFTKSLDCLDIYEVPDFISLVQDEVEWEQQG